jgi:hypothetical protein
MTPRTPQPGLDVAPDSWRPRPLSDREPWLPHVAKDTSSGLRSACSRDSGPVKPSASCVRPSPGRTRLRGARDRRHPQKIGRANAKRRTRAERSS